MQDLLIIGDHTPDDHPVMTQGMRGLVPRGPKEQVGYSAVIPPSKIVPYDQATMINMIADMEKAESRLSDILLRGDGGKEIPSLDQNGQGFCWNYGPATAITAVRARMGLPYKRLSPHATACKQTNFQDVGGWGAKALEFMDANGIPDTDHWKEKSMSRSYDTPETWANAKLYMPSMTFEDLASPNYDRNLSFGQQLTCVLDRNPTADDYDFWSHCVGCCDAVYGGTQRTVTRGESGKLLDLAEFDVVWGMNHPVTGGLAKRIRNSWTDSYGYKGFAVLTGSKAIASNSVAVIAVVA